MRIARPRYPLPPPRLRAQKGGPGPDFPFFSPFLFSTQKPIPPSLPKQTKKHGGGEEKKRRKESGSPWGWKRPRPLSPSHAGAPDGSTAGGKSPPMGAEKLPRGVPPRGPVPPPPNTFTPPPPPPPPTSPGPARFPQFQKAKLNGVLPEKPANGGRGWFLRPRPKPKKRRPPPPGAPPLFGAPRFGTGGRRIPHAPPPRFPPPKKPRFVKPGVAGPPLPPPTAKKKPLGRKERAVLTAPPGPPDGTTPLRRPAFGAPRPPPPVRENLGLFLPPLPRPPQNPETAMRGLPPP